MKTIFKCTVCIFILFGTFFRVFAFDLPTPMSMIQSNFEAPLDLYCSFQSSQNCNLVKKASLIEFRLKLCEENNNSKQCLQFIDKNPKFKSLIPDCSVEGFCKERFTKDWDSTSGCLQGYVNEHIEQVTSFISAIENKNVELESTKSECKDVKCKRDLVSEIPKYKAVSDKDLAKISSEILLYEKRAFENQQGIKLSVKKVKEKMKQAFLNPKELALKMTQKSEDWLKEKNVQTQCLNAKTKSELICRTAAYLIDPLAAVGVLSKGSTVAKYFDEIVTTDLRKDKVNTGPANFGSWITDVNIPNMPENMHISKYRNGLGQEFFIYEKTIKNKIGQAVTVRREVAFDPLTGAIDAKSGGGASFLDDYLQPSKNGAVKGVAFFDIENLGYVNKNFSGKQKAGDGYLKVTSDIIKQAFGKNAQLVRLGGDEYGVIFEGLTSKQVKDKLEKIQTELRKKENRQVFIDEKIRRAEDFKDQAILKSESTIVSQNKLKEFAPYSQPGVSMGSTFVARNETARSAFERAEVFQAKQAKIASKENKNIDTTKYGRDGKPSDPNKNPDFYARVEIKEPIPAPEVVQIEDKKKKTPTRAERVYRLGSLDVDRQVNELGDEVYSYERYSTGHSGMRNRSTREIFINENTGFFDVTHESGQAVYEAALKSGGRSAINNRYVFEVDAKSLGEVNYFANGTGSGDKLLQETGRILSEQFGQKGIPFKKEGSRFHIIVDGLSPAEVKSIESNILKSLKESKVIKQMYEQEILNLKNEGVKIPPQLIEGPKFRVGQKRVQENDSYQSISNELRSRAEP